VAACPVPTDVTEAKGTFACDATAHGQAVISSMAASLIAGAMVGSSCAAEGEAKGEGTDAQAPPARADSAAEQSA